MSAFLQETRYSPREFVLSSLDSLITIKRLAGFLRFWARLVVLARKPFIIGVTGSVGKTTTTEMLFSVLSQSEVAVLKGYVVHSENNMNDDLGLPATLLQFTDLKEDYSPSRLITACLAPFRALKISMGLSHYPKILVLEYGASWDGHIALLADLAPPNIGVVTTIGEAHLERLKTLDGVAKEKMALVSAVPSTGLVVLGNEHSYVSQLAQAARSSVVEVPGKGIQFAENAARVICRHLGVPDVLIESGLRSFRPPKGRQNVIRRKEMTLIDDSYNANPSSMKYGLDALSSFSEPGSRRVAILGFMGELGELAPQFHREIGEYARGRADLLIGVGELAKHYKADHWFESSESCVSHICDLLMPCDCILVKGSGAARMKKVADQIRGRLSN